MTLHKILKYLAIVIGIVGFVLLGRIIVEGSDSISNSADLQGSMIDPFLYLTYIILAVVIALILVFVIKGLFTGDIRETAISIGSFVLIIVIAYLWADSQAITLANGTSISAEGAKWVGTGLKAFYVLGILAIGTMVTAWIKKITTRN